MHNIWAVCNLEEGKINLESPLIYEVIGSALFVLINIAVKIKQKCREPVITKSSEDKDDVEKIGGGGAALDAEDMLHQPLMA